MGETWTADVTNDPNRNFELYIEIMEGSHHRGRVQHNVNGEMEVVVYRGASDCHIPWQWLSEIVTRFDAETRTPRP